MGYHETLADRLIDLLEGRNPGPPGAVEDLMLGKGTGNFVAMAWLGEYARLQRYRDEIPSFAADVLRQQKYEGSYGKFWDEQAVRFFDQQRRDGFMTFGERVEQLCPDPHANFWLLAVLVARLVAREKSDTKMLELTGEWLRNLSALYQAGLTPDGRVILPGARDESIPFTEVGAMVLQVIMKAKMKPRIVKDKEMLAHRFYAAVRAAERLAELGDAFGGAADMTAKDIRNVHLRLRMHVRRTPTGHIAWLDYDRKKDPINMDKFLTTYVAVDYRAKGGKGEKYSRGLTFRRGEETLTIGEAGDLVTS